MARLAECDVCSALSILESVRPVYQDSAAVKSAAIVGVEEDIFCPNCGQRSQIQLDADCPV